MLQREDNGSHTKKSTTWKMEGSPLTRRRRAMPSSNVTTRLQNKENEMTPKAVVRSFSRTASPLTPVQNLVGSMRKKIEKQLEGKLMTPAQKEDGSQEVTGQLTVPDNTSPGLAQLRNTPAHMGLKVKRKVLETKHQDTRNHSDKLNIGGGVCLWPDMENMRLTHAQTLHLILINILLIPVTGWVFYKVHGSLVFDLLDYTDKLKQFNSDHMIEVHGDQHEFDAGVRKWHSKLAILMDEIHGRFDVTWRNTSQHYKLFVLLYVAGITTLLFFLIDNVLAHNKLSPRRIQSWVTLLVVTGLWTLLSLKLLVLAQRLEQTVQDTVHHLNDYMLALVYTSHDPHVYERVLSYWRTCCLPPTSRGVLTVMGLVAVQDVMGYLQYYSLPILTALLSPVVKLVASLKQLYGPTHRDSVSSRVG